MIARMLMAGLSMAAVLIAQGPLKPVVFTEAAPKVGERWNVFESVDTVSVTTIIGGPGEPMLIDNVRRRSTVAKVVASPGPKGSVRARVTYAVRQRRAANSFMLEKVARDPAARRTFDVDLGPPPTVRQVDGRRKADPDTVRSDLGGWWAPLALHRIIPDRPLRLRDQINVGVADARTLFGSLAEDDNQAITTLTLTLTGTRDVGGTPAAIFAMTLAVEGAATIEGTSFQSTTKYSGEMIVAIESTRLLSVEATGALSRKIVPDPSKPKTDAGEKGTCVLSRKIVYAR